MWKQGETSGTPRAECEDMAEAEAGNNEDRGDGAGCEVRVTPTCAGDLRGPAPTHWLTPPHELTPADGLPPPNGQRRGCRHRAAATAWAATDASAAAAASGAANAWAGYAGRRQRMD